MARSLQELITARLPNEAAGVILEDDQVIELRNLAPNPVNTFEISKQELREALAHVEDLSQVTLWHSHPGGGIGPSRIDIQQKTAFHNHLVITVVVDELVYTWY